MNLFENFPLRIGFQAKEVYLQQTWQFMSPNCPKAPVDHREKCKLMSVTAHISLPGCPYILTSSPPLSGGYVLGLPVDARNHGLYRTLYALFFFPIHTY